MCDSDACDQRCGGPTAEGHHVQQALDLFSTKSGCGIFVFRLNAALDQHCRSVRLYLLSPCLRIQDCGDSTPLNDAIQHVHDIVTEFSLEGSQRDTRDALRLGDEQAVGDRKYHELWRTLRTSRRNHWLHEPL